MRSLLVGFFVLAATPAFALNLEEFLAQVQNKHRGLRALELSKEAAGTRREAGDIGLSPVLSLTAKTVDDQKPQALGGYLVDRTKATEYSLGLNKKFSTGTSAGVSANLTESEVSARNLSATPVTTTTATTGVSSLGISLSQSLWKDGFGSATRLRQEREALVESSEKESYNLQAKQLLIEAETAFWDYVYLRDEVAQRKESLDRAKRIETWVKRRVGNGIGDDADSFNAQGLVATRELQLLVAQDDLLASERKIRDLLEMGTSDVFPTVTGDISAGRQMNQMSSGTGQKVRLDSYLATLEAKARAVTAREVEDAYRPDLVLEGAYRTNGSDTSMSEASRKLTNTDLPTTSVGIRFTWLLDGDLKESARQTARAESLAANLRQERKLLEGNSSWEEINRRHAELSKKIQAAQISSQLQNKKAAAERDKLSKGRSITSQVITAEQDASEASLTLNKLRAEQRKLEAQGRLFVTMEDSK